MTIYTIDQAAAVLAADGHDIDAVHAVVDSLIDAGLELPQPDDQRVVTDAEVDVMRDQLAEAVQS